MGPRVGLEECGKSQNLAPSPPPKFDSWSAQPLASRVAVPNELSRPQLVSNKPVYRYLKCFPCALTPCSLTCGYQEVSQY